MSSVGRMVGGGLAAAFVLVGFACSSSSSPAGTPTSDAGAEGAAADAPTTVDFTDACTKFWTATCTKAQDCKLPLFLDEFATPAACVSYFAPVCKQNAGAAGSTATPDAVTACAAATAATCQDVVHVLEVPNPAVCTPTPGTRDDGAPCGSNLQCKGLFCKGLSTTSCGTCAAVAKAGENCSSTLLCGDGLSCVATTGGATCVPLGDAGATCDSAHPCHGGFACVAGKCGDVPPVGTDCDPAAYAACGVGAFGFYCNVTTKKCEAVTESAVGAPCGPLDSGGFGFCALGGHCNPGSLGQPGTCEATIKIGQPCTNFNGPQGGPCEFGATCVSGKCTAEIDLSSCN